MASEIVVTVGADATQLEKGLNEVTSSASKAGSQATAKSTGFVATLGRAYGYFNMIFGVLNSAFEFIQKYATMARELRNLSLSTGIPVSELQRWSVVAKNAGISLSALAHSVAEFNKKMGEAKIRGSEANAALTKLGFGMQDLTTGQINYQDTLYALADAYAAGTDQATLMHYGVQLFGSSFEQMLPLIKQGSGEVRKQFENQYHAEEKWARAAARNADMWDRTKNLIDSAMIDMVGMFQTFGEDVADEINNMLAGAWFATKRIFVDDKSVIRDAAEEVYKQQSSGKTKEERQKYYDYWAKQYGMNDDEKKIFMDRIKELEGGKDGKKLTPLGLSEAQGASSLQQMGGGDIVSAIAFTPLERIATATEETARNTTPRPEGATTPSSVPLEAR